MDRQTENVLVIDNITNEKIQSEHFVRRNLTLYAVLEMRCSGHVTMKVNFQSESGGVTNENEGIRRIIENFLNGRSRIETEISKDDCDCVGHLGINRIEVNLPEPLKTEFERIFSVSNWQNIQLKIK